MKMGGEREIQLIKKPKKEGLLLDVGCGTGEFLGDLKRSLCDENLPPQNSY